MAWNEPGGGGSDSKNNDPWGKKTGRRTGGGGGPPDLDEMVRRIQKKFKALFGSIGKVGGNGGGTSSGGSIEFPSGSDGTKILMVVVGIVVLGWMASGIYIVDQGKRGVELRFGQAVNTSLPGPHWHIPYPIETVEKVDVDQIRTVEVGTRAGQGAADTQTLMVTQDENLINIKFAVQYKVKDARDFLFRVRGPDDTLAQINESVVRELVGKMRMDEVTQEGRSELVARARQQIQTLLDRYGTGLQVTSVNLIEAQAPNEVQDAFLDAIKAREDEARQKSEAEAYANDVIPKARGGAARLTEESNGYKSRAVSQSTGEAARFEAVLAQYEKAPKVTRDRIYLEVMESVLSKSSKILVDTKGGNNMLYLPLDKMMQRDQANNMPASSMNSITPIAPATAEEHKAADKVTGAADTLRKRDATRSREVRP